MTQLASQNSLYSKFKMNWFRFDSVFKHVWKALYCFLLKSFLMFWLHFRGTRILCRSQNPEISPMSYERKKAQKILTPFFEHIFFEAKKSTLWNVYFKEDKTIWKLNEKSKRLQSSAMPPISNKMFYKPENWRVMVNKFHIAAFVCFLYPFPFFYVMFLFLLWKVKLIPMFVFIFKIHL